MRWKAVLAIGLVLVLGLALWQWYDDIGARIRAQMGYEQMEQAFKEQKQALQELQEETERRKRINAKWRNELRQVRTKLSSLEGEIYELEKKSEAMADWAGKPIPRVVLERLRDIYSENRDQDQDQAAPTPGEVAPADQPSEVDRDKEQGSLDPVGEAESNAGSLPNSTEKAPPVEEGAPG